MSLLQVTFSPALSREFRPYKPDPAPLLHICSAWGVQPNEVMMVGDSLKDDVSGAFPDIINIIDVYIIALCIQAGSSAFIPSIIWIFTFPSA